MSSDKTAAEDYDINQHFHDAEECKGPNGRPRPKYASATLRFTDRVFDWIDGPVTWFRDTIVTPNQQKYPWYHRKLARVPTIDQCGIEDHLCIYEANEQFKRDRGVDTGIITILRYRMDDCVREEFPDYQKCFPLKHAYEKASENWYMKYGELGACFHVTGAFMKQKHRLLWERRHGKVGTGMRKQDSECSAEPDSH